ncbi:MAG: hypothetical protein ACK2UO_00935, partial [Caldilineaceae bacterium]
GAPGALPKIRPSRFGLIKTTRRIIPPLPDKLGTKVHCKAPVGNSSGTERLAKSLFSNVRTNALPAIECGPAANEWQQGYHIDCGTDKNIYKND